MGKPSFPKPSLLIIAVTYNPIIEKSFIISKLKDEFGDILEISDEYLFDEFTDYYEEEMGKNLKKFLVSFKPLFEEENLNLLKLKTNEMEEIIQKTFDKRVVNLDPGILSHSKFVLLSTKNYYHRIYVGKGIYAEVTLFYRNKNYCPLDWTYPDYKSELVLDFIKRQRENYLNILKGGK